LRIAVGDVEEFLNSYQQQLQSEVTGQLWPPEITATFTFESCLKHRDGKEVYLVVDKQTNAKAILRTTAAESGESVDTVYQILKDLNYPGIPRVFGTFVGGGRSYMVREYFPGLPLDRFAAQQSLVTVEILDIAKKICGALNYLHAQSPPVIHRDIKPQNIIISPEGSIGLTDFDIARTFKEGSEADTRFAGTMPYAPPEQYGFAQSTPQTDIYALGIVLIFLATGSPSHKDLSKRVTDERLLALIEKCIALDPSQRFQDAAQVIHAIDHPKKKKRRGVRIAAALLVVALLAVGGVLIANYLADTSSTGNPSQGGNAGSLPGPAPDRSSNEWLYDYSNSGNLPANINNGGFVAGEYNYNGKLTNIYIKTIDGIYWLNGEGVVQKLVAPGHGIHNLNYYKGKLYYIRYGSLIEYTSSQRDTRTIIRDCVGDFYFDQGRLYFINTQDENRLYTADLEGKNITKVSDMAQVNFANIINGVMYYADGSDGNFFYRMDLLTGEVDEFKGIRGQWLSVCNGRLYYNDNLYQNTSIKSVNVNGTDEALVLGKSHDNIVATPNGIFAIDTATRSLVVFNGDGTDLAILAEGDITTFFVLQGWVVYQMGADLNNLWMVRFDGTDNHQIDWSVAAG
jgi:hypothetical protein